MAGQRPAPSRRWPYTEDFRSTGHAAPRAPAWPLRLARHFWKILRVAVSPAGLCALLDVLAERLRGRRPKRVIVTVVLSAPPQVFFTTINIGSGQIIAPGDPPTLPKKSATDGPRET